MQRALHGNEDGWNTYTIPTEPEVITVSNLQAKYPAIVRALHNSRINASRTRANGKVTNASRTRANGKVTNASRSNGKVNNGKVTTRSRINNWEKRSPPGPPPL